MYSNPWHGYCFKEEQLFFGLYGGSLITTVPPHKSWAFEFQRIPENPPESLLYKGIFTQSHQRRNPL